MVYSASISIAEAGRGTNGYPAYFLVRHGVYLAVGLLAGLIAFQVPMPMWQKYSFHLFLLGVVLLLLVLIPGHRPRSQRQPALDIADDREFSTIGIHEIVRGVLRRQLYRSQGGFLGSFRKGFFPC